MNLKYHLWSAWGGIVFVVLFGIGWALLAQFVPPPPSPALDARAIADFYQARPTMIRTGLNVVMIACAPMVPFYAALAIQLARAEGRWAILSIAQVALGLANVLFFYIPVVLWQTAAFRLDRDPAIIQTLNDIGWIMIQWPFGLAAMQNIVIAAVIFADRGRPPVFPRWLGYFNVWIAIALAAGVLVPYFKTGPFAWDGLFGFWLPAGFYMTWIAVTSILLVKAVRAHAAIDGA